MKKHSRNLWKRTIKMYLKTHDKKTIRKHTNENESESRIMSLSVSLTVHLSRRAVLIQLNCLNLPYRLIECSRFYQLVQLLPAVSSLDLSLCSKRSENIVRYHAKIENLLKLQTLWWIPINRRWLGTGNQLRFAATLLLSPSSVVVH